MKTNHSLYLCSFLGPHLYQSLFRTLHFCCCMISNLLPFNYPYFILPFKLCCLNARSFFQFFCSCHRLTQGRWVWGWTLEPLLLLLACLDPSFLGPPIQDGDHRTGKEGESSLPCPSYAKGNLEVIGVMRKYLVEFSISAGSQALAGQVQAQSEQTLIIS